MKYLAILILALINYSTFSQNLGEANLILDYRVDSLGFIESEFILPGDYDNDGLTDFITIKTAEMLFNKNLGFGDFETPVTVASPSVNISSSSSALDHFSIDIDQDGNLDVLRLSGLGSFLLLGNGDGSFNIAAIPFSVLESLELYDVENNGSQDVIFSSLNDDNEVEIWAYLNNLDGSFSSVELTETPFTLPSHDIDGDGDLDAFTSSGEELLWLEYEENQLVENHVIDSIPVEITNDQFRKTKIDLDQDGDIDYIISSFSPSSIGFWVYENTPEGFEEHAYLQDGSLEPEALLFYASGVPGVVDFDADGDLDLHYCTIEEGQLIPSIFLNNGELSNFSPLPISGPSYIPGLNFWTDVDGDGDQDVLASGGASSGFGFGQDGGRVFWYPNSLVNLGCSDSNACNYNAEAISNDDYCFYETGCPYENIDSFNDDADCINCGYIFGCMDESALNFNPDADIVELSACIYPSGCTDSCSSNFDPEAITDDGSCDDAFVVYGCTYENALNFNTPPGACVLDDGSCQFTVNLLVFIDENSNGQLDSAEVGLANQTIMIEELGLMLITDELGHSEAVLPSYTVNYELLNPDSFPYNTTLNPINEHTSEPFIYFGVSPEIGMVDLDFSFIPRVEGYPCDDRGEHILCVRNESFNTINARITINYDSIFQDHFPNEFMVEEGEGFMVLELDSLIPFENYSLNSIDFQTPTVDFIGELLETQVNYIGYLGEDTLVMGASFLEIPLTCAYDPNDKAGFPLGYTEHHYIENTQELEYLIRFQNTGNAPATDVKILDDIDEDLDLSTLKVIGNSHHVQTLINMDSREVEFLFENIFLPDSVNNESESHGFILFSVLPHNDLTTDTELENTAEIYFDNNPPIITNTTSHKIWGCELMTFFAGADSLSLCVGDEVSLNPETQFVEFLNWTVNDFSTQAETLEIGIESLDSYAVEVLYSNPYCQAESSIYLNVLGETPPEPFIEEDQFGLVTDNTSAYTYQWFLDGELIQGATQYFLNPSGISGEYQVEITNENGCSSISGPLDIDTSILELNRDGIKMYPNPSVEAVYVDFRTGKVRNVSVFNMNNQLVSTYTNTLEKNRLQINTLDYSKGVYSVLFTLENGEIRKVKLVVL